MTKKVVYLADLMHSNFGLAYNTTPLGIGKIASHILNYFGSDNVEVRLFREFGHLEEVVREKKPDILGLSSYAWNENLTATAFKRFRSFCPDSIFVTGGANISVFGWEADYEAKPFDKLATQYANDLDRKTFELMPDVDFLVHGHGEYPVANIVEAMLGAESNNKIKGSRIAGCTGIQNGIMLPGATVPLPLDLDEFPSPYITGLFDEIIHKYKLPAQLETNRGCPYQCSFCTTGASYNKISKHSFDYTKEEIRWARDNCENKMLRLSDSNFGILEKDVELAEFLMEMKEKDNYPVSVRVYYSTVRANKRTMRIAKMLDRYQPFTISLQSDTPIVLANVGRKNNPPIGDLKKMVDFAHGNGLSVATDLIAGMPGETYESFKETCANVVLAGFDSTYVNSLYLLKGSDLYSDQAREAFGFKTLYAMMSNSVTKVGDEFIVESEEYPVESNDMSNEDFWKLYKVRLFMFMIFGGGYYKELIFHLFSYGISFLDVYEKMISDESRHPHFNGILGSSVEEAKTKKLLPDIETLRAKVKEVLSTDDPVTEGTVIEGTNLLYKIIYMIGNSLKEENKRKFIDEFVDATYLLADEQGLLTDEFRKVTDELADMTADIMISPVGDKEETIVRESDYDLIAWTRSDYAGKVVDYKVEGKKEIHLKVRNFEEQKYIMDRSVGLEDKAIFRMYYGQVNSSNMRRWLREPGEEIRLMQAAE